MMLGRQPGSLICRQVLCWLQHCSHSDSPLPEFPVSNTRPARSDAIDAKDLTSACPTVRDSGATAGTYRPACIDHAAPQVAVTVIEFCYRPPADKPHRVGKRMSYVGGGVQSCCTTTRSLTTLLAWSRM